MSKEKRFLTEKEVELLGYIVRITKKHTEYKPKISKDFPYRTEEEFGLVFEKGDMRILTNIIKKLNRL